MGRPGFEPGADRLKAECSTAELATRAVLEKATLLTYHKQLFDAIYFANFFSKGSRKAD